MNQPHNKYQIPYHNTILVEHPQDPSLNSDHPLFYTKQRNYFLGQLCQKVSTETRLDSNDLKRNLRMHHYLDKYVEKKQQYQKQLKKQKVYLKSHEFKTILEDEQESKRKREQRQQQRLKEKLYQMYIIQKQQHQQPEHDHSESEQYPKTILSMIDPIRQKQLYFLNLEINKLTLQQNLQKKIETKHNSCRNQKLLGKLSNSIISSYMVYFDEIYNLLIDDILQEQVIYLNALQSEYYLGAQTKQSKIHRENPNTLKMIQLVKKLDQLCDD